MTPAVVLLLGALIALVPAAVPPTGFFAGSPSPGDTVQSAPRPTPGETSDRGSRAAPEPPPPPATAPDVGVWPLHPDPAVVKGFDPPLSTYGSGHRGVDLAGAPGQPVRAAAAGRVTFAGSLAGRGVVVVSHGPTRTTYEPVRSSTQVGALVSAGELIGSLERFGSHCAPETCLHWGLIEGETYLDPLTLVGAGPVRLLPLLGDLRRALLGAGGPWTGVVRHPWSPTGTWPRARPSSDA